MRTELQLSLTGRDTETWLAERGWKVVTHGQQPLRVTADFAWTPTFVIGRIWHTPAVMEIVPNTEFEQVTVASFVLDGSMDLLAEGLARSAPAGANFTSAGNAALQLRTKRPSFRLLIGVPSDLFDGVPKRHLLHGHSYRADGSYRRTLVASVTAALGGHVRRNTTPYRYWSVGIEQLLLAATISNIDSDPDLARSTADEAAPTNRVENILGVIDAKAHDPAFSVQQLAEKVNLSRSQVHRLLESTNRTPAMHLRDARLRLAEAQLGEGASAEELRRVALASGFSSPRALREAIRAREGRASA
ncbi:AraC family transcriptional regulator [Pseudoclavibacter sp. VKM Ac-2867]|uniref:AraC family transcriptional regulator n=1 Tax=Pseudoclavibacter sp. VKM Ac-2867 TaxID=2783829 RepID=UPI00188A8A29|nr:helix-turn-helix domain-containing protein [Pseudoclavibacter sp. VKM Ac-2867]MBF4459513.1 AraC family transcriptional regulator [Pseudoclavibacter sp. VKM Ac-2867]